MPPATDTLEIVFVGNYNRFELESQIERLARWPWSLDEDGEVVVLADAHADPIGVRLVNPRATASEVRELLVNLFSAAIVYQGFPVAVARQFTKTK